MRYILNSAVITTPGNYSYSLVSIQEAKDWIGKGGFESTIGYVETAQALSSILSCDVPANRKNIKMNVGDEALVFRLTCRLDDPRLKGSMGIEHIINNCEVGILCKTS